MLLTSSFSSVAHSLIDEWIDMSALLFKFNCLSFVSLLILPGIAVIMLDETSSLVSDVACSESTGNVRNRFFW